MVEDAAPAPDDDGPDQSSGGSGGSQRLADVAEKLLEHLDVAAGLVLSMVQDHIIEPIESIRRGLLVGILLFGVLGVGSIVLGYVDRELFLAIFPYFFGVVCLLVMAGLIRLDQQAKDLKQRVRELARKAETWRKVASWAKNRLD